MILKALGFMDLLVAVTVVLLHYELVGIRFGVVFASYMLLKGIVFRGDIASTIDIFVGLYIILLVLGFHWGIVTYIISIYLLQKVIFSFISL